MPTPANPTALAQQARRSYVERLIGGMPAWRATSDLHACPLVDGVKPHVGGVVAVGSTRVLIGGLPAARLGDSIVEAGAPNAIVAGAMNVLIG